MKTVVIDGVIFSLQNCGGISKVWADILLELDQHYFTQYKIFLLLPKNKNLEWARVSPHLNNITLIKRRRFRWNKRSLFLESLYLTRLAFSLQPSIWHSSYYVGFPLFFKTKRILMFYDMIPEKMGAFDPYLSKAKKLSIEKSDLIHPISKSSLVDLDHFYPNIKAKKEVIPLFHRTSTQQSKENPLPYPYFLYTGRRGGYKNFAPCLTQILEEKEFANIHIVTVGDGDWSTEEEEIITRFHASKRVHNLGVVEPKRVEALLKNASLLLYPSLYEGFGLPILEAFAHGVLVLASKSSSIPEVTGSNYPLCTPSSWKEVLDELLKNRTQWVAYGKKRAKLFTLQNSVKEIHRLYKT